MNTLLISLVTTMLIVGCPEELGTGVRLSPIQYTISDSSVSSASGISAEALPDRFDPIANPVPYDHGNSRYERFLQASQITAPRAGTYVTVAEDPADSPPSPKPFANMLLNQKAMPASRPRIVTHWEPVSTDVPLRDSTVSLPRHLAA